MIRNLYILILTGVSLFAEANNFDLVMTDVTRYDKTATSLSLKDTRISYDVPAISYMAIRPDYLLLAKFKVLPKQHIGTTALGATQIELEQKGYKYELGGGYKFYLSENLFIAPALLFSDYYSSLYKIIGSTVIETKSHDIDLRLYGLLGYKLAKTTIMFVGVELKNDILSSNYSKDYSQYPVSATIYQFLSRNWFGYFKYQHTLRDKEARTDSTGNNGSKAYGFGIGMKF